MTETSNEAFLRLSSDKGIPPHADASVLGFNAPIVEEIAKAIWQRQCDALPSDALVHNLQWRDASLPIKFWNEFLLDANAVIALLYKKHLEFQKTRLTLSNTRPKS
jgi:hypothetical protein